VTLVKLPNAPSVDKAHVDYSAEQILKKGTAQFNYSYCYDPGVPGRQLNMTEPDGRQLRASVYMWDHQLYITEVSAPAGSQTALQFEQSITILDPMGNDLDNGREVRPAPSLAGATWASVCPIARVSQLLAPGVAGSQEHFRRKCRLLSGS
jgi:hypothetical protein